MESKQSEKTREGTNVVVKIRSHENATWQGEVLWVDHRRQSFRSALELIKLIDGALNVTEEVGKMTVG